MTIRQHLAEARVHLLAASAEIEGYIQNREGWEVATPVVASAFGIDHARLTGCDRLLFELCVDTAIDHQDAVKVAVMKARTFRKPADSPVARARRTGVRA